MEKVQHKIIVDDRSGKVQTNTFKQNSHWHRDVD